MKRYYFLILILFFQQSFELDWNPWSTLGSSLNSSKEFLFRLIFPKKDIAYYSKLLDKKVKELDNKNYNPPGYKIGKDKCLNSRWDPNCVNIQLKPQKYYATRFDAIRQYFQDELIKCMGEKNKNLENEFIKLRNELHLPATVNPIIAKNVQGMCRGSICPLGVCKAMGRCLINDEINKANRMQKILEQLPGAFKPCAKDLLGRKY